MSILFSTFVHYFKFIMNRFRFFCKYLQHYVTARHTGGHGVHSPFVYQFVHNVLYQRHSFYVFDAIETLRYKLKRDKRVLEVVDFGTGVNGQRSVSSIAEKSLKSAKFGQLLFRMVHYFKAHSVLELGASLGVTTAYLASSSRHIQCTTFEGCPQIAAVATENFRSLGISNVNLVVGNIDLTLKSALSGMNKLDFVFFDANHRSEAILNYFQICLSQLHGNSVLVIDDIYWSKDMEEAWKQIKEHERVRSTIDLFHFGIVFFNTDLHKRHYKMRY